MGDIINLNEHRKQRARRQKTSDAAANRARFGRTRADKARTEQEGAADARRLDGARRDKPADDSQED